MEVRLYMGEKMKTHVLVCPKCSWISDEGVGMKPFCPDCNKRLDVVSGTKEEIGKYISEIRSKKLEKDK